MSGLFKRQDPAKLQEQLKNINGGGGGYQKDEKEWKPTLDAQGNGSALIRFLPPRSDDELAFVRLVTHGFKMNGNNWYINNCSSTHNDYDGCPVCKYISENDLYEKAKAGGKGSPADKEYNLISRKKGFWANILVLKDPGNTENEGKVFKYRFGTKIMDKINAQLNVDESLGEKAVNVTCCFTGANFKLKIKKVSGFPNYDDSSFNTPSPIEGIEDEKYQAFLMENMSDLRPIVAKDQFKTFEELSQQFNKVRGSAALVGAGASASKDLDAQLNDFDKSLENYDNSASVSGGGSSAGVSNITIDDDEPPFNVDSTSTGSGDDDEDLNALLDGL